MSVGLVQHYYRSKESLLADTLDRVLKDILDRVERSTALAETHHARIEHMLGAGLEQLLPFDAVRLEEARLRMGFAALAIESEELRRYQSRFSRVLRERVSRAIENAGQCGEIPDPTSVDPELESMSLLAMVDGLCNLLLTESASNVEDRARHVIAARMHAIFPGDCAHRSAQSTCDT